MRRHLHLRFPQYQYVKHFRNSVSFLKSLLFNVIAIDRAASLSVVSNAPNGLPAIGAQR